MVSPAVNPQGIPQQILVELWTPSTRFRLPLPSHAVLQTFASLQPQLEDLPRVTAAHAAHQRQTVLDCTPGYGECCCLQYHSATFASMTLPDSAEPPGSPPHFGCRAIFLQPAPRRRTNGISWSCSIGAASAASPRHCRRSSSRRRHRSSHTSSSRRCRRRSPSSRRQRRQLLPRSTRLWQSSSRVFSRAWRARGEVGARSV